MRLKLIVVNKCLSHMFRFISRIYKKLFLGYEDHLCRTLVDCDTVLDLGCGYNSPIQYCRKSVFSVGVELFDPYLQESSRRQLHCQYIKADVMKLALRAKSFEAVLAVELLEHLSKQEGYELISKMQVWATKKVIIITPNGYIKQDSYHNNPLQEHKSGWNVKELRELGFVVYGINGWKVLRGHKASIRFRPTFLWRRLSDITQKVTYHYPEFAFQLLAVHNQNDSNYLINCLKPSC